MLTQQRKHLLLDTLRREGRIVAADLSTALGLSEDTIRRDLRALAAQGLLQRVHGGALPASPAMANFAARSQLHMPGKQAIAAAAAALVQPGQVVFIDGGTTCQQLALRLPPTLQATVVTHSPTIALALVEHPRIEVQLVGGRLFKHSVVAVGAAAVEAIGRVRADLSFMGVTGLSARGLVGLHLLDVFEGQLQLIDGQGLGPAAEAVALHLLDDLAKPLGLGGVGGALGQDQRLERFDILRQSIGQARHGQDYSTSNAP